MLRSSLALILRVFFALVVIGLIGREIAYTPSPPSQGPKFVSPGEKPGQSGDTVEDLNIFELAVEAARDLLGPAPPAEPPSSLQQLDQRNRYNY